MMNKEKIDELLDAREWQTFDCKRARIKPADICKTICAFANSDGGIIAIGLEDPEKATKNNRLIGILEGEDNVSEILNAVKKEFEPPLISVSEQYIDIFNTEGKADKLLLLLIGKSNEVHSLKNGDTYRRDGRMNHKMGAGEIIRLRYEKGALKYEDEDALGLGITDLDNRLLSQFMSDTASSTLDKWQFLKDNGLATRKKDGWHLHKSAILLFGINPATQLKSKCSIKLSHYYGEERNYSGTPNFVTRPFTLEGPLLLQISQAMDYYNRIVKESPPRLVGASFLPSIMIPEWAFQEAVANAVIHRNYYLEDDIQVRIFDNRIEIESPGIYPGHITPFNIRQERFARNPIIQRVLNRFHDAPNLDIGEGVDRIYKIMKDNNLYDPLYSQTKDRPNSVQVTLYNMQRLDYWDTVSSYLDKNHRIDNKSAREITGIKDTAKVSRLFSRWVKDGLLEKVQTGYNGSTYYKKPGSLLSGE